jgi:predicted MFS family arabinose efflux permease
MVRRPGGPAGRRRDVGRARGRPACPPARDRPDLRFPAAHSAPHDLASDPAKEDLVSGPRLGPAPAFFCVVLSFTVVMVGTTMPTPMYPLYEHRLGFSTLVQTVVFAVYAVGVLATLLLCGRWSDVVGRRPMLLAGLGAALASSLVFLGADRVWVLLAGRFLSGVSAGVFLGAATAAVIEAAPPRWSRRAAPVATAANIGGLGLGPLLAGLAVRYLPAPLRLSFAVHAGCVVVCAALVLLVPETVDVAPGARLRPQRPSVPAGLRGTFVTSATAGFAGFALLGLFTAVSPQVVAHVFGRSSAAVAGLVVFLLLGASAAVQLGSRRLPGRGALVGGCALLVAGVLLVGVSVEVASFPLLVAGAVVAGAGQGMSFTKALGALSTGAAPERRAGVTSSYFLVLYVALAVPVVALGAATQAWGLVTTTFAFSVAVAALCAAALLRLLRSRER